MKGDTVLDYAEFQLTPKRTRCELFISADGLMEKLASGFVKPFVTHLHAVEAQVAKGNQVIRLESQGGYGKHHLHRQSDNAWFCKGTLERFVRFVSTPEIIERVKTIEDELSHLEQVRSALVNTFAQNPERFAYGDSTPGGQQSRDGTHAMPRRFSTDMEDNEGDASKRELLRAMEARLSALHQEQNTAFTRANAAGFDSNTIANLMTFADDFGADRLNDACVQFLALARKRMVPKGEQESADTEIPLDGSARVLASGLGTNLVSSDEAWLHGAKRKLDFGANKVQTINSSGLETRMGPVRKDLSQKMSSGLGPIDQTTDPSAGGTFFARLQQMSQQVEARPNEDFGWQMDANEPLSQGSQNDTPDSISKRQAASDESLLESLRNPYNNADSVPSLRERTHSLPALKVRTEGPRLWNASSGDPQSAKNLPEDEACKAKDNAKKPETTFGTEDGKNDGQSTQGETPARRLSVQAAISLFESKKKDSNDPPFRKLIKQESRKALTESGNSPSEKAVLKRWSVASPRSPELNSVQEKKNLESGGAERHQEPTLEKVQDGANKVCSSERMVDPKPHPAPDEQARENFKKSLSSLLHLDSSQHFGRPRELDVMMQHVKQLSPIQQTSNNSLGSIVGQNSKDQSTIDRSSNLPMTKTDTSVPSKAELESSLTAMPTSVKPLKKPVREEKPDSQPATSTTSLDYNGKIEQEDKEKGIMKAQNMKEILPKPSGSVSYRQKISAPVSAPIPMEQDLGPVAPVVHKSEQVFDKKAEATKIKDVPDSDRQSAKNMSYEKSSVTKKSSGRESSNLLTTSVDFHMQALVKMVEHQYTNLNLNGVNTPNEQRGEQRGRLYDQYSKLRDAKLRGEHPMKRAEREAKLKSMQETLERRKAEMETRAVRLSKKKVQGARVVDSGGEKTQPQKASLSVAVVEQKDLKDEEDDTDQEELSLRFQEQSLDYSNPTSPASTPRSSKTRSSSLKLRAPPKIIPTLPKSASIPRNPARAATSSPRPTVKNPGATPGPGKTPSLNNSTGDTIAVKTVLNMKDMAKSSLIRPTASARVHPRSNGATNGVAMLDEDVNNAATLSNPEKKELRHPSLVTRKNAASIAVLKSSPFEAGMLQGSPRDQQEGATDAMADGKPSLGFGATQEVKPFLRKGRGIGPGAGPGIMKQKASVLVDAPKSFDEDTSTDNKQDGAAPNPEDMTSATENPIKVHETEETENIGKIREQVVPDTSCSAMLPNLNDDLISSSSRPSSGGPTDSGEVEALDDLPESASENDKPCPDSNEEHHEGARQGVTNPAAQKVFSQALNNKQKEGTFMLSDLFSQRNAEALPHNAGFVTSSISFREASLPHGHIGSPFPASASHTYSLFQRGAVSSRFSPPRANALDLPTGSPALWNASQASKYIAEPDMIHSNRQLNGQKPSSILPLPPKEPSKGFKRLLHFGRKSRTSETTTTDCVSVSTTSEGDDDADEGREIGSQLSDEVLRKIRMQKRGFEYGNQGDHYAFTDQDTSQFFGSAIPPPPANFKLREEHLSGGNLIKAPRSFFSLSSFRSKGSEGKSR